MVPLEGSDTEKNLRSAFAREAEANLRYRFFAQTADVEGYPELAAVFRAVAEAEAGHAFGILDLLIDAGDPTTGSDIGSTEENLRAAIAGEDRDHQQLYPDYVRTARREGFDDIAEWLETLAEAERGQLERFKDRLSDLF